MYNYIRDLIYYCYIMYYFVKGAWDMACRKLNQWGLTPQEECFCLEYHANGIASKAFLKAYPAAKKWKDTSLYPKASNLLDKDKIKARLQVLEDETKKSVQKNVVLNKTKILEELVTLFENAKASGASERMTSLQAIKLMAQISKLIGDNSQNIQVNIQNNQVTAEVSDYLNL